MTYRRSICNKYTSQWGEKRQERWHWLWGWVVLFWQRENLEQFWSTFTRIRRLEGCWTTGFCFLLIYLPYKFLIVLIALYPSYLPPPLFFFPKALDVFSSKAFTLCVSSHFPDLPSSLFFGLSVLLINHCGSPERSSQKCCVRLSSRPSLSQNSVLEVRSEGGVWEGEGRRTLGLSSTHLAAPNWLLVQEAWNGSAWPVPGSLSEVKRECKADLVCQWASGAPCSVSGAAGRRSHLLHGSKELPFPQEGCVLFGGVSGHPSCSALTGLCSAASTCPRAHFILSAALTVWLRPSLTIP